MRHKKVVCIGGICLALMFLATPCVAQSSIFRIEEDWEMVVHQPDPIIYSPQVTFFTSPSTATESTYFQLQMNYAADEGFDGGGFHVAAVNGGGNIDEARSHTDSPLTVGNDRVQWTSVMAAIDGTLLFAVKDGYATQWGSFGGPDYLVRIEGTDFADLSQYHHSQSLSSVDVGFGGNRVSSITLKQVRLYYTDGHISTIDVNSQP